MTEKKVYSSKKYRAIGLMSGTSLDGIDAALIETDGYEYVKPLAFETQHYEHHLREELRACFGKTERDDEVLMAEEALTRVHIDFLQGLDWQADLIGFHGQTIFHDPSQRKTIQIGDGEMMAKALGVDVIYDFRSADVAAGGEGAPLAPLYHQARVRSQGIKQPCVILNIGGVANVTYIDGEHILAFDTGPGNALMDDFMKQRRGQPFDEGGNLASTGEPHAKIIDAFLEHPYFKKQPPKSLDRDQWTIDMVQALSDQDGMATLLALTTGSLERNEKFLPSKPRNYYVTGGGRKNQFLMEVLNNRLLTRFDIKQLFSAPVQPVEALGWNGDAIEAECFAYLAVRSILGEPLSLPATTGVRMPMAGGVLAKARGKAA